MLKMYSTLQLFNAAHAESMTARSWSISSDNTMIAVYAEGDSYVGTIDGNLVIKGGCKSDREILSRIATRVRGQAR